MQVMVDEGERSANGEGVQPQRHLGEFDRHRVLVHAIDAAFEDHAADDVSVVELFLIDGPVRRLGIF